MESSNYQQPNQDLHHILSDIQPHPTNNSPLDSNTQNLSTRPH